ncbi:MFS transporter [Saccharopolyspora sp. K220]|uniref:MDR family MFS transporter n=1 Tax=Saccharopolyspora soli TaxID=2926618 RepID=UPI001F59E215|nr:MFS transporter [Saccharopolyspora soli]MCI2424225.1 MFS transporter [Saccharopolyspora soli]
MDTTSHRPTRLRDLSAAFWWLWFAELVIWVGRFVVPFMTIFLTTEVGLSAGQAGLVLAAYGAGVVASSLTGGIVADRVGRKTTLIGSQLLSVVVLVIIPLAEGRLLISALLAVYGLFNGASQPAIVTMIGDLVEPRHRRTAFNYSYWAVNLGYGVGPMLAGFMADMDFGLLFYAQAALVLVSACIVALKVPETRTARKTEPFALGAADESETPRGHRGVLGVLRDRVFMTFTVVMLLYSLVYVQSTTTLPLVMTEQGIPSRYYGYLLTLNGLLLCVLQLPTARFLARWSREAIVVVAICLTAVGVGLQAAASTLAMYLVTVFIWTLGEMGSHPQAQSISADLAEHRRRGRYQGIYGMHHSLAMVIGPVLGGLVLDTLGAHVLWISSGIAALGVALLLVLTARERQSRIKVRTAAQTARRHTLDGRSRDAWTHTAISPGTDASQEGAGRHGHHSTTDSQGIVAAKHEPFA